VKPALPERGRALALVAVGALGCTVETASDPSLEEAGTTHALVTITRRASAVAPEDVRADAIASFVRLPSDADPDKVLRAAGLAVDLPAAGTCFKATGQPRDAGSMTRVELLDAGEVTVAAGGNVTTLAPRAFPSVTDSIAGVVYTTRDRAAEPLPSALSYTVATSGADAVGPVSADAFAPIALSGVTVLGAPLAEVRTLAARRDLELAWSPGAAGDRIVVVLERGDSVTRCAFGDEVGRGTLPVSELPAAGTATLAVHRLRQARFTSAGIAGGELRFDFELEAPVTIE
jgi:hypothetical protein